MNYDFFSSNFNPLQSKTFYYGFKSLIIFFYSGLVSDDSLKSTVHFNGTMNFYWNNCKMKNKFITGNTDIVCQNTATWTGIRKYKIGTNKVFKLKFIRCKLSFNDKWIVSAIGYSNLFLFIFFFLEKINLIYNYKNISLEYNLCTIVEIFYEKSIHDVMLVR